MTAQDPLLDKSFKAPGILEMLREAFLGSGRWLDCAQIEITSHCMGACDYCPHTTNSQSWRQKHMAAETYAKLWPILRVCGRAHLQGWGEPLLHPRFEDFAKFAAKAGCAVSTTSSGMGLDDQKAEALVRLGLDLVAFSLTGTDPESNSARKNIPFEKVCEAIACLNRAKSINGAGPDIHLSYLLLADRLESVKKLPGLMEKLDVNVAIVSTLDFLALPEHEELAFAPGEWEKIRHAEDILSEAAAKAAMLGRKIHYSLPSMEPDAYAGGCRENVLHTLYVNTEGDISPCVYLNVQGNGNNAKIYGNVNEENIINIWDNIDYAQFRHRLAAGHPDAQCLSCPKRFEKAY